MRVSIARRGLRAALVALAAYALVAAAMFVLQRQLQYVPDPSPLPPPAAVGLPRAVAEVLPTADGQRLTAWWVAPADDARPMYLYLHGNGAHLASRARRFARLTADGAGLYAVSWRGYGGSTGSPTEAGLIEDARAAYARLAREVAPRRIVVYGESLGTTVAVLLAAEVETAGLVLDSSFASALALAADAYPWLPVGWLLRDRYRADLAAPNVTVPVLQVHCADDPVTPLAHAKALHALLREPRPIALVDGRCHVPPLDRYEAALRAFVAAVVPRP